MKRKHIFLFLCLFLLLGVAYFFITAYTPEKAPQPSETPLIPISVFEADAVQEIEVTNSHGKYTFSKKTDEWQLKDNPAAQILSGRVTALCHSIASFSAVRIIEKNPSDSSVYGFSSPMASICATLSDNTMHFIYIGQSAPAGDGYYCKSGSDPTVYLVNSGFVSALTEPLRSYRNLQITSLDTNAIRGITLSLEGHVLRLSYRESQEGKYAAAISNWRMESPTQCDAENAKVSEKLLQPLSMLTAVDVAADTIENASSYGFSGDFVEIKTESETIKLKIGEKNGRTYLVQDGKAPIYDMGAAKLSFMTLTPFDVIEPMINLIPLDDVARVEITIPDCQKTLEILRFEEKVDYRIDSKPMDEKAFKSLYMELVGLSVDGLSDKSVLSGAAPIGNITYYKTDGSQEKNDYYAYDALNYAVSHNGNAGFYMKKTKLSDLADKLNA